MIRTLRFLTLAMLALAVQGCVAFHSLPTRDYTEAAPPGVTRIVFDERGDPWPLDADPAAQAQIPADLDKQKHFSLVRRMARSGAGYDRETILAEAARRIAPGGRVVVLIKGFNNSYGSFRSKFAATREWLKAQGAAPDQRYLEVYWDALHRAGGKVPYPVALFPRARSNAARMAQCGLRDLLARLPDGTEVTFVAHSLGAVAALDSMVVPPQGWPEVTCTGRDAVPPVPSNLADVRIAAFAPAVGAGQLSQGGRIDPARFAALARLYIAWNPHDPAVTKHGKGLNLPDTLGGDTRLGGNTGFVARIDRQFALGGAGPLFQPLEFSQPAHELASYLADRNRAACVLWAAKVLPDKPAVCALER